MLYLWLYHEYAQEVSINKYFDDAMLLELAKHEADKEMEME